MAEAIFGLIGVVIGGLLNGGVTWLVDRSKRKAGSKTAARIVIAEIHSNEIAIDLALEDRKWAFVKEAVSLQAGDDHRAMLARTLDDDAWLAFDHYYARTRELVKLAEMSRGRQRIKDDEMTELRTHLSNQTKRANVELSRAAGLVPVGERYESS
jgi:hypothetical protein